MFKGVIDLSRKGNASKRRKSFYSFRKEYPNDFEGNRNRKPEKHTVLSATIIAVILVIIVVIGYFLSSVIFEIANKPIPEQVTIYNEIEN